MSRRHLMYASMLTFCLAFWVLVVALIAWVL